MGEKVYTYDGDIFKSVGVQIVEHLKKKMIQNTALFFLLMQQRKS